MKFCILAALVGAAAGATHKMDYVGPKDVNIGTIEEPELDGVITVDRTFNTVSGATGKLTLDKDCSSSDDYGSNDCTLNLGDTITLTYDFELQEDIKEGAKFSLDAKLDNVVPFTAICAACGQDCSITVPVIKKTIDIKMPDCPIAAGTKISNSTTVTLPTKSPIPFALSGKGTLTVTDDQGNKMLDLDFEAALK
mmetsp:Transcript_6184/g.8952  ORF Transcript_6184/g.8952 Transcript_6184/m.8952 type:complete len:195 (-) Transcript_6184:119-703(-)|eukprot:CAMPEP_0195516982 /NCGR_PEP_ID=MMETSP0794_2-20130614/9459_1 /TAXON_ID=515487 /ORGANISM="Stephanopyxis turris, Strain CCMP 815" /LENGTH=194 /DNA_ID=CAMNT_0040645707 /DNA_START=66 /DNA_END=650 /DNA_ORIENTATION=+